VRIKSIIDSHDLLARQAQLRAMLWQAFPTMPIQPDRVDERVLSEDYFVRMPFPRDAGEFAEYDRFDHTLAISSSDRRVIQAHTYRTNVALVPASCDVVATSNSYASDAMFATGPNPFNIHGYVYFVRKVLPRVLEGEPSFRLDVLGYVSSVVQPVAGVQLRGFVDDLGPCYASARFAISPVLGGTGQQVKIVEAMAHGVPVIAFKSVAEGSPIEHGVNGLLADSAAEFAEHVVRLWRDRRLCQQLGHAAREEIRANWSQAQTTQRLGQVLTDERRVHR
jgi:hypothetical protein